MKKDEILIYTDTRRGWFGGGGGGGGSSEIF